MTVATIPGSVPVFVLGWASAFGLGIVVGRWWRWCRRRV
jgi:hypothetical protein